MWEDCIIARLKLHSVSRFLEAKKPYPSEIGKICRRKKFFKHDFNPGLRLRTQMRTEEGGGMAGCQRASPQGHWESRYREEWGMGSSPSWLNDSVWLQATLSAAGDSFSRRPEGGGFRNCFAAMREIDGEWVLSRGAGACHAWLRKTLKMLKSN